MEERRCCTNRPNILILMTDQQRADVIMPDHPCQTPNINKLMKEGITFTNAFTPMAHCCPSRASLMTGMYPSKHGIFNNVLNTAAIHVDLNPGCETFSEKLKEAGYKLAYTGKWHVSGLRNPKDFGWEELELCAEAGAFRNDYESYDNLPKEDASPRKKGEIVMRGWPRRVIYGISDNTFESNYRFIRSGLKKLKEFLAQEDPWCLFISLPGPHGPFIIPEKYAKMYSPKDIELPPNYYDKMENKPGLYKRMQEKYRQLTEEEVKESIAYYWGYCTMLDEMFGEVLVELDKSEAKDNTLVIFLSDHGEFCGSHGLYAKGIPPFDEGYRIPYVMRWPNGIKSPGRIIESFITHCDISPTLTEIAGASPTKDPSGRSLVPFFKGEIPSDWPDAFYSQCNGVEIYYTQRMVRTKKYKLVYNPVDRDELYDLENDPYEMTNIIDKPEMKKVVEELFCKLWRRAKQERDYMNSYHTVSLAPVGPAVALGKD